VVVAKRKADSIARLRRECEKILARSQSDALRLQAIEELRKVAETEGRLAVASPGDTQLVAYYIDELRAREAQELLQKGCSPNEVRGRIGSLLYDDLMAGRRGPYSVRTAEKRPSLSTDAARPEGGPPAGARSYRPGGQDHPVSAHEGEVRAR
jgi:hypothetical protein